MPGSALVLIDNIKNLISLDCNLSCDRRHKIDAFKFEDDKKRCIMAELLLRIGLKELGYDTSNGIAYQYNEWGKPYLKNIQNVFFNISHSGEYVVCALADNEIGIDIEQIKDIDVKIAKGLFHPNEYSQIINEENEQKRLDLFYNYWVRKESYVKALGEGMHFEFNTFDVTSPNFQYKITEIHDILGYKIALCSKNNLSLKIMNLDCEHK